MLYLCNAGVTPCIRTSLEVFVCFSVLRAAISVVEMPWKSEEVTNPAGDILLDGFTSGLPGSGIVHSSHLNKSLGSDTSPTPALFMARARNSYRCPCCRLLTLGWRADMVSSALWGWGGQQDTEEVEKTQLNPWCSCCQLRSKWIPCKLAEELAECWLHASLAQSGRAGPGNIPRSLFLLCVSGLSNQWSSQSCHSAAAQSHVGLRDRLGTEGQTQQEWSAQRPPSPLQVTEKPLDVSLEVPCLVPYGLCGRKNGSSGLIKWGTTEG